MRGNKLVILLKQLLFQKVACGQPQQGPQQDPQQRGSDSCHIETSCHLPSDTADAISAAAAAAQISMLPPGGPHQKQQHHQQLHSVMSHPTTDSAVSCRRSSSSSSSSSYCEDSFGRPFTSISSSSSSSLDSQVSSNGSASSSGISSSSLRVLYHQTSLENAQAILASGRMVPGKKGFGGGGIYFAEEPAVTHCKAQCKGAILECVVELGRVKRVKSKARLGDYSARFWQWLYGYDSVCLLCMDDGTEYIVYHTKRVKSVRLYELISSYCAAQQGEPASAA